MAFDSYRSHPDKAYRVQCSMRPIPSYEVDRDLPKRATEADGAEQIQHHDLLMILTGAALRLTAQLLHASKCVSPTEFLDGSLIVFPEIR